MENIKQKTQDLHIVCRKQKPDSYPDRFPVPDEKVSWGEIFPEYNPQYFVHLEVTENSTTEHNKGLADFEDFSKVTRRSFSELEDLHFLKDFAGLPLNIAGRTGIAGRGLLYNWGANQAVDVVAFAINDGKLCFLSIKRKDNGLWGTVGGFVNYGEEKIDAARRELGEEVPQFKNLDLGLFQKNYQVYSDDSRNTDNSWIETTVFSVVLPSQLFTDVFSGLDPTEVTAVAWIPVSEGLKLHADNAKYVYSATRKFISENKSEISNLVISQCEFLFE